MRKLFRFPRAAQTWLQRIGVLPTIVDVKAVDGETATPLARVLEVLNAAVPKVPYERLTKAQRTIAEASVYISRHYVEKAITFLRELESDPSVDPKWLEDVIWCLEATQQMPGCDPEGFVVRQDRQRKQREYEIERLDRIVNERNER